LVGAVEVSILRSLFAPLPPAEPDVDLGAQRFDPFGFQGNTYYGLGRPLSWKGESTEADFPGLSTAGYKSNGVVFACMQTRLSIFSEARFQFRRIRNGRPGDLFGTPDLDILERPWTNGTTSDLLKRMITDADLAGNFYGVLRPSGLKRLRPDWVSIVIGVQGDSKADSTDIDAEILGYIYQPGGANMGKDPVPLLASEVVHFAPVPDPLASYRGMSWLSPIVRELEGDGAATDHKLQFFRQGGSPRLSVVFPDGVTQQTVNEFADRMDAQTAGASNAYRTMYLGGGADVTVVGADMQQLDFKATQGAGETRIAAAAGVSPVVVGLSEGLQGSSLNAGNFNSARRLVADKTMRPLWRDASSALANVVNVPGGSELWYDTRDIAFLREDLKERADVQFIKAQTIKQLVEAGFTPESASKAVEAEDMNLLQHSGLTSVQLQKPGTSPASTPPPEGDSMNGSTNGQNGQRVTA
jgi:phage portal protein BeeE